MNAWLVSTLDLASEIISEINLQADFIKQFRNVICQLAKSLCAILVILLPLQACCKRRIVKKRAKIVVKSYEPIKHKVPLKQKKIKALIAIPLKSNKPSSNSRWMALNQKAKSVISEVLKKQTKDLDKTQVEAPKDDEENSNTFNFDKVRWLGNLDDIMKEQKSKTIKEIEDMKSFHEMETFEPLQPVTDSQLHVKIAEKKSRLYETDNDESIDEETNETLL